MPLLEAIDPVQGRGHRPGWTRVSAGGGPASGLATDKAVPTVASELGAQLVTPASIQRDVAQGPLHPTEHRLAPGPPSLGPQRFLGDLATGRLGQAVGDPEECRGPLGAEVRLGPQERGTPADRRPGRAALDAAMT